MKTKRILAFVLIVCIFSAFFAGCKKQEKQPESKEQAKYVLRIGLNDKGEGKQVLSVDGAKGVARGIIVSKGLGYTEYVAYGAYTEDDTVKSNDTLVYEFMFCEKKEVEEIAKEIKQKLNLDSILMEQTMSEFNFVK